MAEELKGKVPIWLTTERVQQHIIGKQNYSKGERMLATRHVSDLKESCEENWTFTAAVHAEMTANKHYIVKMGFSGEEIRTTCSCAARYARG